MVEQNTSNIWVRVQILDRNILILSKLLMLLSISVTIRRDVSILYSRTTISIILSSIIILILNMDLTLLEKGIATYGGLFYITSLTQIFKIFVLIVANIIILLTSFYPRRIVKENIESSKILSEFKYNEDKTKKNSVISFYLNKMSEQFRIIEYCLIILFILIGVILLLSNNDLVSLFLSIELQSYGLYLLCSLYKNSELSTSSGLTYFLLGGLASCFILLGIGLLYANSGNLNLDSIYIISSLSNTTYEDLSIIEWYKPYYIHYSLIILSVGLLFKISAAPFHFWSPEVYDNVPTIVTTFIAIVPKLSILICLLELVHYTGNILIDSGLTWTSSLLLSSLFSLIIGTVLGLTQSRIKRLFAYSTISHLGFILLAMSVNSIESNQAFIFYLMQYTISNLNAFFLLLCMGYVLSLYINNNVDYNKLKDKNNSPIQLTNQLKGYYYINPMLALSLAITLFSFAGVPPLIGFFAKQMVLSSALDKGYTFLVLVAILTSVIGAVYYLGIIKRMYFDKHEYSNYKTSSSYNIKQVDQWKKYIDLTNITISAYLSITISIITIIILLFVLFPQEFLNMSNILTLVLYI